MNKFFAVSIVLVLTIFVGQHAHAQENVKKYSNVIAQLNKLLKDKNYQQAYRFADANTYDFGGLPEFDLLTAFAAYGNGNYQEALFALERVVIEEPSSYLARTYLALTYQKINNLPAALNEVNKLLRRPLLSTQRDKAENLKLRIERQLFNQQQTWGHNITGSFAYDNNINSGTYFDTVNIPNLGEIELFESAKQTRDISYSINYAANYQYPLSQYQSLRADASLSHTDFLSHNEYRRNLVSIGVAYIHEFQSSTLNTSLFKKPLFIEGQDYRDETGISLRWSMDLSKSTGVNATVSQSLVTKDEIGDLDIGRTKGAVSYLWRSKLIHSITGHWYQDTNKTLGFAYNAKTATGAMYQLTWPISDVLVSSSYYMFEQHSYDAEHPLFLKIRDEQLHFLSSQLVFTSTERLNIKLFLNMQKKTSNVDLFSYNRMELGASWQYRL